MHRFMKKFSTLFNVLAGLGLGQALTGNWKPAAVLSILAALWHGLTVATEP